MDNRFDLPKLDPDNLEVWLSLLADRELSSEAQRELASFLDQHPQYWRACAIQLWDESSLRDAYRQSDRIAPGFERADSTTGRGEFETLVPPCPRKRADRSESAIVSTSHLKVARKQEINTDLSSNRLTRWCAAAAILMIVFGGGWLSGNKLGDVAQLNNEHDQLIAEVGDLKQLTSNLAAGWAAEQSMLRSVADLFPDAPMLLEIESTPWRTVYLTDRPASNQMISTLASMSREVTVEPFRPEIVTPLWRSLNRPVVAIEVLKNDFPLLTGVQR